MAKRDKDIINKSVTFDRMDPDQQADLEHAEQRSNFSAYIRMLIRLDRLQQHVPVIVMQPQPATEEVVINEKDSEAFI